MRNNELAQNVAPFRSKHHSPDRADPETARKAFASIRENLGHDPMAEIWNDKLNSIQKHGLWLVAGLPGADDGEYHKQWRRFTDSQKARVKKVISTFAGLATRIQGAK